MSFLEVRCISISNKKEIIIINKKNILKQFSDDYRLEFGPDKFAKTIFFRGKAKNITLDTTTFIKNIEPEKSYSSVGLTEGDGKEHSSMRKEIQEECFRRMRSIKKSELKARNRIDAIKHSL